MIFDHIDVKNVVVARQFCDLCFVDHKVWSCVAYVCSVCLVRKTLTETGTPGSLHQPKIDMEAPYSIESSASWLSTEENFLF